MNSKKYFEMLAKLNLKEINDYNQYRDEISFYRDHIQPMTDKQGNDFRHLAGSAAFAQKYGIVKTNMAGFMKEFDDFFYKKKKFDDSMGDLNNNIKGSLMGEGLKSLPRHDLYKKIFDNYIKNKPTGFASDVDSSSSGENSSKYMDKDGNRIYTREDLHNMSKDELQKHEPEIIKQYHKMGIPTQAEIKTSLNKTRPQTVSESRDISNSGGNWVTINGNHVLLN